MTVKTINPGDCIVFVASWAPEPVIGIVAKVSPSTCMTERHDRVNKDYILGVIGAEKASEAMQVYQDFGLALSDARSKRDAAFRRLYQ